MVRNLQNVCKIAHHNNYTMTFLTYTCMRVLTVHNYRCILSGQAAMPSQYNIKRFSCIPQPPQVVAN